MMKEVGIPHLLSESFIPSDGISLKTLSKGTADLRCYLPLMSAPYWDAEKTTFCYDTAFRKRYFLVWQYATILLGKQHVQEVF